jgi:hypothetical protein
MSELDHASLSASKKLVENGIMLETDAVWVKWYFDGSILSDRNPYEWRLQYKALIQTDFESIPAPCFMEVWRELPEVHKTESGIECRLQLDKIRRNDGVVVSSAQYVYGDEDQYVIKFFANINPADALAELLIWVKGQEVNHDRP